MEHLESLRNKLISGEKTCVALVTHFLRKIDEAAHLNAFLEVFNEEALSRAEELDRKRNSGQPIGKLHGLVVSIKDNICFKNHRVSASSKILEGFSSVYSSTVVERLLAEDAIIIGRCNCDEFAMGSSNEKSAFGPVLNSVNTSRVPGGSSGGSAVSVAAGLCMASLGTDTGGSIRQPAAYTGVVGVKPSYGRISRHGIIAYASSFDQVGPFTNSVEDAYAILQVLAGPDEYDATLLEDNLPPSEDVFVSDNTPKNIAYFSEFLHHEGIGEEVKKAFLDKLDQLKGLGHQVRAVSFPYLDYLVPAYYVLTTAEASSNLSRYDGIHYGYRSRKATDLESTYKLSRSEGFGTEVKRRIMLGTFVLSEGYYDAYYGRAQKVRRLLRNAVDEVFEQNDFIVTPTSPGVAFPFGEKSADPVAMYLEDIYTVLANLTGIPALSIPLSRNSEGLPMGFQVMAPHGADAAMMRFSAQIA